MNTNCNADIYPSRLRDPIDVVTAVGLYTRPPCLENPDFIVFENRIYRPLNPEDQPDPSFAVLILSLLQPTFPLDSKENAQSTSGLTNEKNTQNPLTEKKVTKDVRQPASTQPLMHSPSRQDKRNYTFHRYDKNCEVTKTTGLYSTFSYLSPAARKNLKMMSQYGSDKSRLPMDAFRICMFCLTRTSLSWHHTESGFDLCDGCYSKKPFRTAFKPPFC